MVELMYHSIVNDTLVASELCVDMGYDLLS